jgi:hypothetical protein
MPTALCTKTKKKKFYPEEIMEEGEEEEKVVVVVTLSLQKHQLLRTFAHTLQLHHTEYKHSFNEWRLK